MFFKTVSSKENATVKQIAELRKSAAARRESRRFVIEGLRLCLDAVECGYRPEIFLFTAEFQKKNPGTVEEIAGKSRECLCVSSDIAAKLSDTVTPQGILCVLSEPAPRGFDRFGKYIGLENIADPGNLGTVARTAEAMNLSGIVFFGKGCDPYSPKAQRAAMGALLRLPVYFYRDVKAFQTEAPGVKIYAAVPRGGMTPSGVDFSSPCVVVVGNEANGLSAATVNESDCKLTLPMSGKADSLNVAAAAAIFMWEMVRSTENG